MSDSQTATASPATSCNTVTIPSIRQRNDILPNGVLQVQSGANLLPATRANLCRIESNNVMRGPLFPFPSPATSSEHRLPVEEDISGDNESKSVRTVRSSDSSSNGHGVNGSRFHHNNISFKANAESDGIVDEGILSLQKAASMPVLNALSSDEYFSMRPRSLSCPTSCTSLDTFLRWKHGHPAHDEEVITEGKKLKLPPPVYGKLHACCPYRKLLLFLVITLSMVVLR